MVEQGLGYELGIIPAYAGSTGLAGAGVGGEGDHPRIRGEHTRATINRADPAGSSPHTRGALDFGRTVVVAGRIIPAYAGSTSPWTASPR